MQSGSVVLSDGAIVTVAAEGRAVHLAVSRDPRHGAHATGRAWMSAKENRELAALLLAVGEELEPEHVGTGETVLPSPVQRAEATHTPPRGA
jgi:hypothetical protein